MKNMWNELAVYRPHTTDPTILLKQAEEDKIFQLLANLSPEYEDLWSHILINLEPPPFASVCATIQREETKRRAINVHTKTNISEVRVYLSNSRHFEDKRNEGKWSDLKCNYCNNLNHSANHCWDLHLDLKEKFARDNMEE